VEPVNPNQNNEPIRPIAEKNFSRTSLIAITTSIIAIIFLATGVVFFNKSNNLAKELSVKNDELSDLEKKANDFEKELIFYKNTDLGKELELVNLKLETSEEKLKQTQESLATVEKDLDNLQEKVSEIPNLTRTISLMAGTLAKPPGQCFSEQDKIKINAELSKIGDASWTQLWNNFIDNTGSSDCSHSPEIFVQPIDYGLNKIVESSK